MIVHADVLPLLEEACPSIVADLRARDELDDELLYLTAHRFVEAVLARLDSGEQEVAAAFALIERLRVEGDRYVAELATIGFLESLLSWDPPVLAERERWLGPESRRWWKGLIAFWPTVLAVDRSGPTPRP